MRFSQELLVFLDFAKTPRNLWETYGCLRKFLGNSRILIAFCKICLGIPSTLRDSGWNFRGLWEIFGCLRKTPGCVFFLSLSLSLFLSLGPWQGGGLGGWGGGAHARGARRHRVRPLVPPPPQSPIPSFLLWVVSSLSFSLCLSFLGRGLGFLNLLAKPKFGMLSPELIRKDLVVATRQGLLLRNLWAICCRLLP